MATDRQASAAASGNGAFAEHRCRASVDKPALSQGSRPLNPGSSARMPRSQGRGPSSLLLLLEAFCQELLECP